jgi:hypothetical protein
MRVKSGLVCLHRGAALLFGLHVNVLSAWINRVEERKYQKCFPCWKLMSQVEGRDLGIH